MTVTARDYLDTGIANFGLLGGAKNLAAAAAARLLLVRALDVFALPVHGLARHDIGRRARLLVQQASNARVA